MSHLYNFLPVLSPSRGGKAKTSLFTPLFRYIFNEAVGVYLSLSSTIELDSVAEPFSHSNALCESSLQCFMEILCGRPNQYLRSFYRGCNYDPCLRRDNISFLGIIQYYAWMGFRCEAYNQCMSWYFVVEPIADVWLGWLFRVFMLFQWHVLSCGDKHTVNICFYHKRREFCILIKLVLPIFR